MSSLFRFCAGRLRVPNARCCLGLIVAGMVWPQPSYAELEIAASTSFIQPGDAGLLANLYRVVPLRNGTAFLADVTSPRNKTAVVVNLGGRLSAFLAERFGAIQPTRESSPFLALAADGDTTIVVSRTGTLNSRVGVFSIGPDRAVTEIADITEFFRSVGSAASIAQVAASDGVVALSAFNFVTRPLTPIEPTYRLALVRGGSVSVIAAANGPQGFGRFDNLVLFPGPILYFGTTVNGVRHVYQWREGAFTLLIRGGEPAMGAPLQVGSFAVAGDGALAVADPAGRRIMQWRNGQWSELAREKSIASDGTSWQMTLTSQVLKVDDSQVYFTGSRAYHYASGAIVDREDIVFRISRSGGTLETYFHPDRAGLDGTRVSLTSVAMGSSSELTISASENSLSPNLGIQRAIWRGTPPFRPVTFPAVPAGYPELNLALHTPDYAQPGRPLTIAVQTDNPGTIAYAWSHDEVPISNDSDLYRGARTAQLIVWPYVQPYHTGGYTVAVTNAVGTSYARAAFDIRGFGSQDGVGTFFPLVNISVKAFTGSGDNALMAGMALLPRLLSLGFANGRDFRNYETGVPRRVLIRAVGPGLAPFAGAQSLPPATRLTLFRDGEVVAANDGNWSENPGVIVTAAAAGAFPLPGGSRDSALLLDLPQQNYTARIDAPNGDGTALIEVYAISGAGNIRNISARGRVTEDDPRTLTIGFVIAEAANGIPYRTILLRAVGPGLRPLNVAEASPAVQVQLFQGATRLAANADFRTAPNAPEIESVGAAYGAFPLTDGDAALLLTLPAGVYTARISAAPGRSGVALAELYTNIGF